MDNRDIPIGETFEYDDKTYIVEEEREYRSCEDCSFYDFDRNALKRGCAPRVCVGSVRKDSKGVIFKEVKKQTRRRQQPHNG